MNVETFREYCLNKTGGSESFPFNESVLVFKVLGKMFALTDLNAEFKISLKCDPEKAIDLREKYSSIKAAYHFNKKYWNTIYIDGSLSDTIIYQLIDHSYDMVVSKMTKKEKMKLKYLK